MEAVDKQTPRDVIAASTDEMLATLPPGLLQTSGSSRGEPRVADVASLYRAVFLNSSDAIAILDVDGRYVEQNVAHEMLLGYSDAELAGITPEHHMGAAAFNLVLQDLTRLGACRHEVVSRAKDGSERVIDLSAFAVRDRRRQPVCYVAIKRDITEQRRASQELARRFEELQVIYRIVDALGHSVAPQAVYEVAIEALLQVLRADRAAVLLFDADGVMRFKAWRGLSDAYRAAVQGHSPWTRDTRNPRPVLVGDARSDPALAGLWPVIEQEGIHALAFIPLVDDGTLLGKLMIYCDMPRQWSEADMQLAGTIARHVSFAIVRQCREHELKEANRAKSAFLATMSHELRTPLNAIAGYTDLLDAGIHGPLSPSQADAVRRIQINQQHLLRLIDDVLNFAKLEAGQLQFEMALVPVQETLHATCALIETQLRAKGIAFEFEPGDARVTCRGDRAKVQQIMANLLSNAWKFTPAGGVVRLDWEASEGHVRMSVRDSGPGIAAKDIEAAFQPFVQLHTGFSGRAEGTGLGLAISRELARAMGGDVTARSEVGKGSTFTLTLARR